MHLSEGPEATKTRLEVREAENKNCQAKMLGWADLSVGQRNGVRW